MSEIKGYQKLTEEQTALINTAKDLEASLLAQLKIIQLYSDQKWRDIAQTHFEEGFMALVRAIARPHG